MDQDAIKTQISIVNSKVKKSAENLSLFSKFVKYSSIFLPTIFALLVFIYNLPENPQGISTFMLIIIVVGVFMVVLSILSFFIQKEEDIFIGEAIKSKESLEKYSKLIENNKDLNNYIDSYGEAKLVELKQVQEFVILIRDSFPRILNDILQSRSNKQNFYPNLCHFLDMLYEKLNYIYDHSENQLFTVAIYLQDPNEESEYDLKPYYSKKPEIMSKGRGRWWKKADGQIGLAFYKKTPFNYSNIHKQINPKTENNKEDDEIKYVSAISIPFFTNPDESEIDNKIPRGVFCITSDLEASFCADEDEEVKDCNFKKCVDIKESCAKITALIVELLFNEVFDRKISAEPFTCLPEADYDKIKAENPKNRKNASPSIANILKEN